MKSTIYIKISRRVLSIESNCNGKKVPAVSSLPLSNIYLK